MTREGEIIGGGVLDIRWDSGEFLIVEFLISRGLLTGLPLEGKLNLALLGVEFVLVDCRAGLITLLEYKNNKII